MMENSPKPFREVRPWGEFVKFTENSPSTVKIITVKAGESTSLQRHKNRDEFWYIISGQGSVQVGENILQVETGAETFVQRETNHRLSGGKSDLQILEISFGTFDENDITRVDDKYGRVDTK